MKTSGRILTVALLLALALSALAATKHVNPGSLATSLSVATTTGPGDAIGYVKGASAAQTGVSSYSWQTVFAGTPTAITTNLEGSIDAEAYSDGAITSGLAVFKSASAGFSAGDVGKEIVIEGAGAAGAKLVTTISGYTNATTVTLAAPAGTTVAAGKFIYGHWFTLDTSASTTSEMRHVVYKPVVYLRCNIAAYVVNGSTTTCKVWAQ